MNTRWSAGRRPRHKRHGVVIVLLMASVFSLSGCTGGLDDLSLDTSTDDETRFTVNITLAATDGGAEIIWAAWTPTGGLPKNLSVFASPVPRSAAVESYPGGPVLMAASPVTDHALNGTPAPPGVALDMSPTTFEGSLSVSLAGGEWHLRVRLDDGLGGVAWSNEAHVEVAEPAPSSPLVVTAGDDQELRDVDGDGRAWITLQASATPGPGQRIVAYRWWDGEVLVGESPFTTVERSIGQHTFWLEVLYRDDAGSQETATDEVRFTVVANAAPTARAASDVVARDHDGDGQEVVRLNGSRSTDPDGRIDRYKWFLGQEALLEARIGWVTLPVGTHHLTFVVTDNGGASANDTIRVQVYENAAPIAHLASPETKIDLDDDGSETFAMDATGSSDADGHIASYHWTVANTTAVTEGPMTNLTLPVGVHDLTLTVEDDGGAQGSTTVVVKVDPFPAPPVAAYDHACAELACTFDGTASTGHALSFDWTFGDGATASGATVTHSFADHGVFPVVLKVTDAFGRAANTSASADLRPNLPISVTSAAFAEGGEIPYAHGCRFGIDPIIYMLVSPDLLGLSTSPPLSFTAPPGTTHLALMVVEKERDLAHWLAWNIPVPASGRLDLPAGTLPPGSVQGQDEITGNTGYLPVCGSLPSNHGTFEFQVYALSRNLTSDADTTRPALLEQIIDKTLGEATLTATYTNRVCDPGEEDQCVPLA